MNEDTYIWSDPHLGHQNIIRYCSRPFTLIEEMDSALIKGWRETVKAQDTLISLGDMFFKTWTKERVLALVTSMPGKKILILGNHDRAHSLAWWRDVGFDEVYPYPIIYRDWYILSHEPLFLNDKMPYINIHGHTHNVSLDSKSYINVSVDVINFKPILFESLIPPAERQKTKNRVVNY